MSLNKFKMPKLLDKQEVDTTEDGRLDKMEDNLEKGRKVKSKKKDK